MPRARKGSRSSLPEIESGDIHCRTARTDGHVEDPKIRRIEEEVERLFFRFCFRTEARHQVDSLVPRGKRLSNS
jgi:hypothetical protein